MKMSELFENDYVRQMRRELVAAKRQGLGTAETDTGYAILNSDGSMRVNNSGYIQELTPKMVQQAWDNAKFLDLHPDYLEDLEMDYEGAELQQEIKDSRPRRRFGFEYDFGEELHTIPRSEDFEF